MDKEAPPEEPRVREPWTRDACELDVAWGRLSTLRTLETQTLTAPVPLPRRAPLRTPTLLVRGEGPGAGQSTIVMALALAWASRGRSVLVVDLDPAEDLARSLHVGWAMRPGADHTVAHALAYRRPLLPDASILPGLHIARLGAHPEGREALARCTAPPDLRTLLARDVYDHVLIDLPHAAGLPVLAGLAAARIDVVTARPMPEPPAQIAPMGLPPRVASLLNRWTPTSGPAAAWVRPDGTLPVGSWLETPFPTLALPLGAGPAPWCLLTGLAGNDADEACLGVTAELDTLLLHAQGTGAAA